MYTAFFGLSEAPFNITPDPRYLFMSQRHQEALAHLLFGLQEGGGFVLLSGEVGTGKTTLCRGLLEQLPPHVDAALVLNPRLSALELVATICDEFGVEYDYAGMSLKGLVDALNAFLLDAHARGRRPVVVIDEAQNLSVDVLEQVRLLTNLETAQHKLLQIILVGQPELRSLLAKPELRQLAQRITARCHLTALKPAETRNYVRHRLAVAGLHAELFTRLALASTHWRTRGIPRRINILCDRALLAGYVAGRRRIGWRLVRHAAHELAGDAADTARRRGWRLAMPVVLAMLLGAVLVREGPALRDAWQSRFGPAASLLASRAPTAPVLETATPMAPTPILEPQMAAQRAPQPPPLQALLQTADIDVGLDRAAATLLGLWNQEAGQLAGDTLCAKARSVGLRCLHAQGTWNNLRANKVPAVLELGLSDGARRYVVLSELSEDRAGLLIDGYPFHYPLAEIEPLWFGQYLALWRPPALERELIKPGARGMDVLWLRDRLDALFGPEPALQHEAVFDQRLKERVMRFQRNEHLPVDGAVGERTLQRLQALAMPAGQPGLTPPTPN